MIVVLAFKQNPLKNTNRLFPIIQPQRTGERKKTTSLQTRGLQSVAHFAGCVNYFFLIPGVSLRSTPGLMLAPAPQAKSRLTANG
jgi:hypothetical protein